MNALLGTANLVLREVEEHSPRAVVLCFGPDAAEYRVELYDGYHAERPEVPGGARAAVRRRARLLRGVRLDGGGARLARGGRPARVLRPPRGGGRRARARHDRGPRHVPVRVRPRDRALRAHRRQGRRAGGSGRGSPAATAWRRSWCPTSSRCAATPRTGSPAPAGSARRRRPSCSGATARSRRRWTAPCAKRARRVRAALLDQRDELLRFKDIATLRDAGVKPPPGSGHRLRRRRGRRPRPRDGATGQAAGGRLGGQQRAHLAHGCGSVTPAASGQVRRSSVAASEALRARSRVRGRSAKTTLVHPVQTGPCAAGSGPPPVRIQARRADSRATTPCWAATSAARSQSLRP